MDVWVKDYVGIDYIVRGETQESCDCLGLVKLIYKDIFNITFPDYNNIGTDDLSLTEKEINKNLGDWVKIDWPEKYCVALLKIAGFPVHLGLVLDDEYMLHSLKGHNSCIERYTGAKWKHRIEGFYKFKQCQDSE